MNTRTLSLFLILAAFLLTWPEAARAHHRCPSGCHGRHDPRWCRHSVVPTPYGYGLVTRPSHGAFPYVINPFSPVWPAAVGYAYSYGVSPTWSLPYAGLPSPGTPVAAGVPALAQAPSQPLPVTASVQIDQIMVPWVYVRSFAGTSAWHHPNTNVKGVLRYGEAVRVLAWYGNWVAVRTEDGRNIEGFVPAWAVTGGLPATAGGYFLAPSGR